MSRKNVTFLASLGAGLEYYDFVIYALMTPFLAKLFFPKGDAFVALLTTLGIFAMGYALRPLGGVLAGVLADRFGRKSTFLVVMLVMASATFTMGLLPTYAAWGGVSALCLVLLRALQGMSFGAELPGAITVVSEYAQPQKRGVHCGFVVSSASFGSVLATCVLYFLNSRFSEALILEWAWRIPFLLGGLLAVVSYVLRASMDETPEFLHNKPLLKHTSFWGPLKTLFRNYMRTTFFACGLSLLPASLIITNIFYPTLLKGSYAYSQSDLYLATTYSLIWSALTTPFCGMLADIWGKERLFLTAAAAFIPTVLGAFMLLNLGTFSSLLTFMILNQIAISLLMSSYFALLADRFPVDVRYTGMAFCYNTVYVLASLLPMAYSSLMQKGLSAWVVPFLLIGIAAIAAVSAFKLMPRQEVVLQPV